jgi:murein DD-endopeptidase MepM/ murein hydrolase activator NlpD
VIRPPAGATTSGAIGADGGTQSIANIVSVVWPAGAVSGSTPISVSATATLDTYDDFTATTAIFQPGARRLYEIRINTGAVAPKAAVQAKVSLPPDLLSLVTTTTGIQAFVQILQASTDDSIDSFELIDSTIDLTGKTVQWNVPAAAFTTTRTADGSNEAVVTLGVTPGPNLNTGTTAPPIASTVPTACQARSIGSPLAGVTPAQLVKTDPFNPPSHYGVDLRAKDGDGIVAVADGAIFKKGFQVASGPNRTGGTQKGWGNYVILKTNDGSAVLYAHLDAASTAGLVEGAAVKVGDSLGAVDSSGGVNAPHLHLEYAPGGAIFSKVSKIDPFPCIGATVAGSIQVGDNGTAADDAFSAKVDGLDLGTTTIGGKNNLAVNNLRAGNHTLTIQCVVAPDNDGTLGIILSNGWKFTNGTSTVSDNLTLNQVVDYPFVVPQP